MKINDLEELLIKDIMEKTKNKKLKPKELVEIYSGIDLPEEEEDFIGQVISEWEYDPNKDQQYQDQDQDQDQQYQDQQYQDQQDQDQQYQDQQYQDQQDQDQQYQDQDQDQ